MILGFEDAFMDIQSDMVSLCMEFAGIEVDKIYIYVYQVKGMYTFNAFFKKVGKVMSINDLGDDSLIESFFDIGGGDVKKLINTCEKYKHKCPNEMKLIYDVKSGSFDAHYGYEEYDENTSPVEVFLDWMDKEENLINF